MLELKPIKITRRHLAKGVGAGEWQRVPERGNSMYKVSQKKEKKSLSQKGWLSVVTKKLAWQKRKRCTGQAGVEARNLVKPCEALGHAKDFADFYSGGKRKVLKYFKQ